MANYMDNNNATEVFGAYASKINKIDPISITWANYQLLSEADKNSHRYIITDYPAQGAGQQLGTAAFKNTGVANGVADLDANGKVPASQLPSYVDDIIEGYLYNGVFYSDSEHEHAITGETGKIYVDLVSDKTYRWSGSAYVEISESLALGDTSSTAYPGNKGKANADNIFVIQKLIPSGASSSNKLATASDIPVITGKADKVSGATNGNLAGLDASGNLTDSGIAAGNTNISSIGDGTVSGAISAENGAIEAITNVYGSKNLLSPLKGVQSHDGITITPNDDGSITISGSNTKGEDIYFYYDCKDLPNSTYIQTYTNIPTGVVSGFAIGNAGAWIIGERFTNAVYQIGFAINANANFSTPVTFYPMIRDARISDSTYVPYAMTNRELTEKLNFKYTDLGNSGTDVNDLTSPGVYSIYISDANQHGAVMNQWNIIYVAPLNNNPDYVIQRCFYANGTYVRHRTDGIWKPWVTLSTHEIGWIYNVTNDQELSLQLTEDWRNYPSLIVCFYTGWQACYLTGTIVSAVLLSTTNGYFATWGVDDQIRCKIVPDYNDYTKLKITCTFIGSFSEIANDFHIYAST